MDESLKNQLLDLQHDIVQLKHQIQNLLEVQEYQLQQQQQLSTTTIQELSKATSTINVALQDNHHRWERASNYLLKHAAQLSQSFDPKALESISHKHRRAIDNITLRSIRQIKKLVTWFHWKNCLIVTAAAFLASVVTSMYLTDELPWEVHQTVKQERYYGKALMNAWSELTDFEKQKLQRHFKQKQA